MGLPARVRILAWVHVVLGGIGLGLTALLLLIATVDSDPAHRDVVMIFLWPLAGLSIVYFIPSFTGGLGVLKGIYWARGMLWLQTVFLAPLVPVGTVLAGFTLWALLPRPSEMPRDGGMAAFEQFVLRYRRAAVLALAAWATLGAMIGLGYIFRDVIDPPQQQELTPLPDFDRVIPKPPERPDFSNLPGVRPDRPAPETPTEPPSDGTER